MRLIALLIPIFFSLALSGQLTTIVIPQHHFGIDHDRNIIVSHLNPEYTPPPGSAIERFELDGRIYTLGATIWNVKIGERYQVTDGEKQYDLYFSEVPIVRIWAKSAIVDEPKRPARLVYADQNEIIDVMIGIELRGQRSVTYPKKTYDIEVWEDTLSRKSLDVSFAGLRKDDDWVLDALYNEPTRVSSYVAQKVWLDMHQPYYQHLESQAKSGVDLTWCEVFFNGSYNGIYTLSEQVDRKLLKLKKFDEDDRIRGELYKPYIHSPSTRFESLPQLSNEARSNWEGFSVKYPKPEEVLSWDNLYDLIEFVTQANDVRFQNQNAEYLQRENMIDYLLFINFLGLYDNVGKNLYIAKYDTYEPYIFVPWDLDTAFGYDTNGGTSTRSVALINTNQLQRRLLHNTNGVFKNELCYRFRELRSRGILSAEGLQARLQNSIAFLTRNGVYDREQLVWPGTILDASDKSQYSSNWITRKFATLEEFWVCDEVELITLTTNPAISSDFKVSPNPANDYIQIYPIVSQSTPYSILGLDGSYQGGGNLEEGQHTIDAIHLPPGAYFLKVGFRVLKVMLN